MTIYYKASFGGIEPVDVDKETTYYVYINGGRTDKDSNLQWIRKTRDEAKAAMLKHYQYTVDIAELNLKERLDRLEKARTL